MGYNLTKYTMLILPLLILTTSAEVDPTLVGVKVGEIYSIKVEDGYLALELVDNETVSSFFEDFHPYEGFQIDYTPKGIPIVVPVGEEFTIKILSLPTTHQGGSYLVKFDDYESEDSFYPEYLGPFIVSIDWENHRSVLEYEITSETHDNTDAIIEYEIIDTEYEFGYRASADFTETEGDPVIGNEFHYQQVYELRYNRLTGVLSKRYVSMTITGDFGTYQQLIHLTGPPPSTNSGFKVYSPKLDLFIITIIPLLYLYRQKLHN